MPRKNKSRKVKREKERNGRRYTLKKRGNVFIQSKGLVKSVNFLNGKKEERGLEWDSDYNGKKAHVNLQMIQNGKKKTIHKEFDHSEIEDLLSLPSVKQNLDQRLIQDFPLV
jgi:hypothetical protein